MLVALIMAACLDALVSYLLALEISWELTAHGKETATWLAKRLEGLIWELCNLAVSLP